MAVLLFYMIFLQNPIQGAKVDVFFYTCNFFLQKSKKKSQMLRECIKFINFAPVI